jgi:hypothetical protein
MFIGAGREMMLADAPYFQAIAQVEADGRIVDVLCLKKNGVTSTIARPIRGTVEQQRADTVATEQPPYDNILDTRHRAPLFHIQQDYARHLPISQCHVAALRAGKPGLDRFERALVGAQILVKRQINRHLAQLKGERGLTRNLCLPVAPLKIAMHMQREDAIRLKTIIQRVQRGRVRHLYRTHLDLRADLWICSIHDLTSP